MLSVKSLPDQRRDGRAPKATLKDILLPLLNTAHEHEISYVRANDQQHKAGNHHQDLEPVLVSFAHTRDAGASGAQDIDVCLGNFARALRSISPQCERSHCFSSTRFEA